MSANNPEKLLFWADQGVTLRLDNGVLKAIGDPTPPQLELLRDNKAALIAELTANPSLSEPATHAARVKESRQPTPRAEYPALQHQPQEPLQHHTAVREPMPPIRAPNSLKGEPRAPEGAYVITPRVIIEALGRVKIMRVNEVYDLLKQAPVYYWANISGYKATYARNWSYTAAIGDRQRLAEDAAILWLRQQIMDLIAV